MIYIVCPNQQVGRDYVILELKGSPSDREIRYITNASVQLGGLRDIELQVGDKVHVISTNEHPLTWRLYKEWHNIEVRAGLPPRQNVPYIR